MHDNNDTDQEDRAVTTDDLETHFDRVSSQIIIASAMPTAAVGYVADSGGQAVLFAGAIFFLWLGYAIRWSGGPHQLWNATLGRASTFHIEETVEERLEEREPT